MNGKSDINCIVPKMSTGKMSTGKMHLHSVYICLGNCWQYTNCSGAQLDGHDLAQGVPGILLLAIIVECLSMRQLNHAFNSELCIYNM